MDPYIGEIRLFAGAFAPEGWAFCHGQLLDITAHRSLFDIIGNQYGGDGMTTFALPDLRGRAPMHYGHGPGLSPRPFNTKGGSREVTLTVDHLPPHRHVPACSTTGNDRSPAGAFWANAPGSAKTALPIYSGTANVTMSSLALEPTGEGQPHNNMQPYLMINFIIALEGIYPVKL